MLARFDYDGTRIRFENSASVWILDQLNGIDMLYDMRGLIRGYCQLEDEQLKGYKPTTKFTGMNNLPVALYGAEQ